MLDYTDKPWMRPCQYTDMGPKDTLRPEVPLEGDTDPVTAIPRVEGDRSAVKPTGPGRDTTPLHYRRASNVKNVFGIDDNDELGDEPTEEQPAPTY